MTMSQYVYINGKHYDSLKASVSVYDAGFLYGDGLFETLRGCKGSLFYLDLHLERLFGSMRALRYNPGFNREDVKKAVSGLIKVNNLEDSKIYIKIIVTRNRYENRFSFSDAVRPNLIIIAMLLVPYPEDFYKHGVAVYSSSIKRHALGNEIHRHKLLNYFDNIYAKNEAYANQSQEALFLTRDRIVLEGASSNIFTVKGDMLFTTPENMDILPGITRKAVIDLCKKHGIACSQRRLHYYNLLEADEVFLTSSVMGIMPVSKIDTHILERIKIPGIMTSFISGLYEEDTLNQHA
ncbi:MAG: D-alanine aminotransferase [Actinobacteria bacterium ADurb.Bin346]|nr:MAG: D-alanine aminotransferase [Actinobacteria bacterium ADurb.Bin346]